MTDVSQAELSVKILSPFSHLVQKKTAGKRICTIPMTKHREDVYYDIMIVSSYFVFLFVLDVAHRNLSLYLTSPILISILYYSTSCAAR